MEKILCDDTMETISIDHIENGNFVWMWHESARNRYNTITLLPEEARQAAEYILNELGLKTPAISEECFWCHKDFQPKAHNYAHVGGRGEVPGCNACLELTPDVPYCPK